MPSAGTIALQHDQSPGRVRGFSLVIAILYCLILVTVGRASAVFRDVYRGSNMPLNWQMNLVSSIHLSWAVPVAVLASSLFVLKDRSLSPTVVNRVNGAGLGLITLFFFVWLFAAFSPIFHHSGLIRGN